MPGYKCKFIIRKPEEDLLDFEKRINAIMETIGNGNQNMEMKVVWIEEIKIMVAVITYTTQP